MAWALLLCCTWAGVGGGSQEPGVRGEMVSLDLLQSLPAGDGQQVCDLSSEQCSVAASQLLRSQSVKSSHKDAV